MLVLLLLAAAVSTVAASAGDRDTLFLQCLSKCKRSECTEPQSTRPPSNPLPFDQRLTFWSCPDDCAYTCMHSITEMRKAHGEEIVQYYGKWPFIRLWGIQEPASVAFSIANFVVHRAGLSAVRRRIPQRYELLGWTVAIPWIAMNAWVWSAVFHTRDKPWTEKADYFSAILYILYLACFAVVRLFHLNRDRVGLVVVAAVAGLFYTAHVTYLTVFPFDYTYNMIAGVVIGVSSNLLWVGWAVLNWRKRTYVWKIVATTLGLSLAMALELLDFPPLWGTFDAHSMWHAATVPLTVLFYRFLIDDAQSLRENQLRGQPIVGRIGCSTVTAK
ncbi:Per1-like-domain-containing protein [Cladochytrium replicatum]|nr:Per1-like-domain-containing protein [Cladochytrium replicatum]